MGTVVEQIDSKGVALSGPDDTVSPQTQFAVEVVLSPKGKQPGRITVSQGGGVDPIGKELVLVEGNPLLQAGETVVFSTNHDRDTGWYTIVGGPCGTVRASSETGRAELTTRFESAVQDQFVPKPDPDNNPPPDTDDRQRDGSSPGDADARKRGQAAG